MHIKSAKAAQRSVWLGTTALLGAALAAPIQANAQDVGASDIAESYEAEDSAPVVVTGSRIRRSDTTTFSPVAVTDAQSLTDRGIYSAADAINLSTSATPNFNQAAGNGDSAGNGQQFPDLFGLGTGRTLTLLNGRRMVTSSSGLGDAQVDANIIPTGLIKRIEIAQAGAAAVYGSDAIAGVVNYILKDDFEGLELDAQYGITDRDDYETYSFRGTAGTNFADDRGNIAVNVEYSKTPSLMMSDRARSALGRQLRPNPADTGANDGIPSRMEAFDVRFWEFNENGVIFAIPAPVAGLMPTVDGERLQFSPDGQSVVPYDVGDNYGVPFGEGGDGFKYSNLAGLRTGVERVTANVIAHYDVTDTMRLSTELLYAHTRGEELPQGQSRTILNSAATGFGPISFFVDNPYLSDEAAATLTQSTAAINPNLGAAFASGAAPLYLSKYFYGLVNSDQIITTTDTYRGLVSLDDEFMVGDRDFYWSVSGSYGRVEGESAGWGVETTKFNNAINAVQVGNDIVCSINADNDPSNDDPNCAPINPFGADSVSPEARSYVSIATGSSYVNEQIDFLATLGGSLATLPAGDLGFSVAYEHRDESASFEPFYADANGLYGGGNITPSSSGSYNTDELSAELLVPLVGGDFTLPLVQELEATGAFRYVDNSLAGTENVWSLGLRWTVTDGVTLRGSRSRNFRAPTLTQLLAPNSTALATINVDPCDADRIGLGPNPDVRYANCLALFEANPAYGASDAPDGATAAERLALFLDPAENYARTYVTSGGNPDLGNEVSDTWSYGIVLQPTFIPGLTITADRIEVDLEGGLSAFTTTNFAETCVDNIDQPTEFCDAFTRLAADDGTSVAGTIIEGRTTTVNAGITRFKGEIYNVNYMVPLRDIFAGNPGSLELSVEATHTSLLETSITGTDYTRTDDTAAQPDWVGRFDLRYYKGPFRFTYQIQFRGETRAAFDQTVENNPNPTLDANWLHNLSAQYEIGNFTLRGGVNNLFDTMPSYPSLSYGDIIGRRFFVGANFKY